MTKLFVNNLTVIDVSYLHPDRGLLGESWLLDVELDGSLDHQGMVLDFGEIKQQVKQMADSEFDHKLLIPTNYSGTYVVSQGQYIEVRFECQDGQYVRYSGPASSVCLLDAEEISPNAVAESIEALLRPNLPENVAWLKIGLRHEQREGSFYQVSHGLKYHAGNCQRIAHGHRSYIEISQDGCRSPVLESDWASRWCDIYIGNRADLAEELEVNEAVYCRFAYESEQGVFELELPRERCYMIATDSTIEHLAQHIADKLKIESPGSNFRVCGFEGIDKGAVAES